MEPVYRLLRLNSEYLTQKLAEFIVALPSPFAVLFVQFLESHLRLVEREGVFAFQRIEQLNYGQPVLLLICSQRGQRLWTDVRTIKNADSRWAA